ncbi:MAG: hypothetical protein EOP48_15065 [Sphingobacteriales bacterium]|jgi:hypothetical protein|nr:MAG: hypothetical protein EOP48_15065 [Sphingobacteriales bacterium]
MDNSNNAVHARIIELFKDMGAELFAPYRFHYRHSTEAEPDVLEDECFMSVLSASAEGIKILCYIRFATDVGAYIFNGDNVHRSSEQIRDLCGELNNQLVGKVKNRLLAFECRLILGLPTHLSGKKLAASCSTHAVVATHTYSSTAGNLDVVVHTIIHDEFAMADEPDESLVGAVEEGTLAFF